MQRLLGAPVIAERTVVGGYTIAPRHIVTLADGRTAFVKRAVDDQTSDNLCLRDGRCLIVDWNWTARGNPQLDLAFWLPSLRLEGGPEPSAAHNLRAVQRAQLEVALPWAARALGLSRPRPR